MSGVSGPRSWLIFKGALADFAPILTPCKALRSTGGFFFETEEALEVLLEDFTEPIITNPFVAMNVITINVVVKTT